MAVVKKLFISGIRSFSPNDNKEQLVEFQTPLHIILGVNGSGKTVRPQLDFLSECNNLLSFTYFGQIDDH